MSSETGKRIGAYELVRLCGSGAYGEVFVARNVLTGERAALKKLFPAPKTVKRELAGLIRWRDCRHPNLLRIRHVEETPDAFYYTMDLADDLGGGTGEYLPDTLANRLEKRGRLPAAEVEKLADALTGALEFLHGRGIVHRDVKPDNILWIDGVPTLGDPGLAADAAGMSLVGTPEFMPAEVLQKKRAALPADDFYALRLVLYCAFTGEAPGNYPHCPAGVLDENSSALWRRILDGEKAAAVPRPSRRAWRYALAAGVLLLACLGVWLFAARRKPVPVTKTQPPPPRPAASRAGSEDRKPEYSPKFMLEHELPKLLARYEEDDAAYEYFRKSAELHDRRFRDDLDALRDQLLFRKEFGELDEAGYAAAAEELDRRAAAGRERDVFLKLYECRKRLAAHLERAHMYPIHATGDVAEGAERDFYDETRKLLEERRRLIAHLRAAPGAAAEFALPHSLWNLTDELEKAAPRYHWDIVAEDQKLKAFYARHRAELRQAAAKLPSDGDPAELEKRLEELTAKYSGKEKTLYSLCLLHAKFVDCPARRERRLARTPENIRFHAALFRLNRDLAARL